MNDFRTWMDRLADEIAERPKPVTLGAMVCASGISPSGPIHMGNLREVLTTHLVVEALRRRGVDAVHLHSWDDYDRLRRVPAGVDDSYQRYVGMPLSAVPDPWGVTDSYASHFIEEFTAALAALGVEMREITQSTQYSPGAYTRRSAAPWTVAAGVRHARRAADPRPSRPARGGPAARVSPVSAVLRGVRQG